MGRTPLLFLLAAGAAFASEPDGDRPKAKAEVSATVTVSAEAMPVEQAKTPAVVRVIDAEAIRRSGARTLGQLLEQLLPGQVMSNGGPGTSATLRMNGSRGEDVLVLVDGLRVSDASGLGAVNVNGLSLSGIERVELLSGPCSSLYGANAAGGVVALYTAAGVKEGFSLESMAALGTRSRRQVQAAPGFGWGSGWARVGVDASEEQAPTDTRNPFRQMATFLGLGQQVGEGLLTASYRNAYQGVPIPYVSLAYGLYNGDRETTQRNEQLSAAYKVNLAPSLLLDLSLGQALQSRVETRTLVNGGYAYDSRRTQEGLGLHWRPEGGFGASLLLEGFDEKGVMPAYPSGQDSATARHFGGVMEAFWEPASVLRLVGSYRRQKDSQRFEPALAGESLPDRDADAGTWRFGATFLFPGGHRFYASGGTGFGVPYLSAVLYHADYWLNPANFTYNPAGYKPLENERSRTAQVGYGYADGPWSFRLDAQQTTYDNLMYFDLISYDYANGQNLRIQGVEMALAYRVKGWGAELFARNQEARDLGVAPELQLSTSAVVRRPFNSVGLSGYLERGSFRVDGRWSWSGARYENYGGFPSVLGADKTHFNDLGLLATWTFRPGLSLGLRGEHLLQPRISRQDWLDGTYAMKNDSSQIYGFPSQAPIWSLELRYRF